MTVTTHEILLRDAQDAINDLFSDRSVDQSQTRRSLEELRDEIDVMLETLPKEQ
jgi:hypothetical protein